MKVRTARNQYWSNILIASMTLYKGLKYTARHFFKAHRSRTPIGLDNDSYFKQDGLSTLQYPHESFPIPDNGRYRLHNEIDDCIVCDKCAKVCPVDCIDIEPIKAVGEIGKTSDGTTKRIHAAKFDIDMSKCCFCGLCTTVCPTECLTMTKAYEFSEFDVQDHTYAFSILDEQQIAEKRKELEIFEKEKQKVQEDKKAGPQTSEAPIAKPGGGKPVFKPKMKPAIEKEEGDDESVQKKPVFKPKMKPVIRKAGEHSEKPTASKPVMKPGPVFKKPESTESESKPKSQARPVFKKPEGADAESKPKKQLKPITRPKKDKDE